jgi:TRAP-type mannitol/chloroaromatic compound transport system substrate-binding protein
VSKGVKIHAYSNEIMKAAQTAAYELYEEEAAKNPQFKKLYASWRPFRDELTLWHRVAELTYANFAAANPPPPMK